MSFDISHDALVEGNPQGEVVVVGADSRYAIERIAGRSVDDVANQGAVGGIPVLHRIDVADGATASIDTILTHKERVIEAWLVKTVAAGGVSDTITVQNGSAAISNAMVINVADQTVVRAGTIDDANHQIPAGGTLRIVRTKVSAANVACVVYVLCVRVA